MSPITGSTVSLYYVVYKQPDVIFRQLYSTFAFLLYSYCVLLLCTLTIYMRTRN